jgi:IS5 family transposase
MKRKIETSFTLADALVFEHPSAGFLEKVETLIDWHPLERILKKTLGRNQDATGLEGYPPLMMVKVLMLQRWYNLSDTQTEDALFDRISFMKFIGLSLTSAKPDSTTICRFRAALIEKKLDQKLLEMLNHQFETSGLLIKTGAIIDASVVASSRRPRKKINLLPEDRNEGETPELGPKHQIEFSADTEANWIKKLGKTIYGYKAHVMMDASHGFYLGGHTTAANRFDGKKLGGLIEAIPLKEQTIIYADKAYWSAENKELLQAQDLADGLMKKAVRGKPLNEADQARNRLISSHRYKIERGFGTLKREYGLARARYLGAKKLNFEWAFSGLCFNVKKAVNLCY